MVKSEPIVNGKAPPPLPDIVGPGDVKPNRTRGHFKGAKEGQSASGEGLNASRAAFCTKKREATKNHTKRRSEGGQVHLKGVPPLQPPSFFEPCFMVAWVSPLHVSYPTPVHLRRGGPRSFPPSRGREKGQEALHSPTRHLTCVGYA